MAESFENYDNILRDWAKDKAQKSLAEALNRFEKPEKRKIKPFLLEWYRNNFLAASVGSRVRLSHAQTWSW